LRERDGLELVALRGRLMQRRASVPRRGMVALLGAGAAENATALAAAHGSRRERQLAPAGRAVRRARAAARAADGKRSGYGRWTSL